MKRDSRQKCSLFLNKCSLFLKKCSLFLRKRLTYGGHLFPFLAIRISLGFRKLKIAALEFVGVKQLNSNCFV